MSRTLTRDLTEGRPLKLIETVYGNADYQTGRVIRANFYKCGDETPIPHFGMWSPVDNETPDFHRPEYFGKFILI